MTTTHVLLHTATLLVEDGWQLTAEVVKECGAGVLDDGHGDGGAA